jgi:hypothetical protein
MGPLFYYGSWVGLLTRGPSLVQLMTKNVTNPTTREAPVNNPTQPPPHGARRASSLIQMPARNDQASGRMSSPGFVFRTGARKAEPR